VKSFWSWIANVEAGVLGLKKSGEGEVLVNGCCEGVRSFGWWKANVGVLRPGTVAGVCPEKHTFE
jgi:hypothetical protein